MRRGGACAIACAIACAERGARRRRAQEVDRENHTWGNYIMCAYKGVHEHLERAARPAPPLVGLQLLVEGRVPQGAPGGLRYHHARAPVVDGRESCRVL